SAFAWCASVSEGARSAPKTGTTTGENLVSRGDFRCATGGRESAGQVVATALWAVCAQYKEGGLNNARALRIGDVRTAHRAVATTGGGFAALVEAALWEHRRTGAACSSSR